MINLADQTFVPRGTNALPISSESIQRFLVQLNSDWNLVENHHLTRDFQFSDFQQALEYTNGIGAIAEEINHHPEIVLTWGKVTITVWTHTVDGLAEGDFVFAARCDRLYEEMQMARGWR